RQIVAIPRGGSSRGRPCGPRILPLYFERMEAMSLGQMMRLSVAMPILLVLSVLVMGQALERLYVYWFSRRLPGGLWDRAKARLEEGDVEGALALFRMSHGVLARAFERLLSLPEPTTERLVEAFQLYRQTFEMDLSRRVGLFGTASFISPLIGLMGT